MVSSAPSKSSAANSASALYPELDPLQPNYLAGDFNVLVINVDGTIAMVTVGDGQPRSNESVGIHAMGSSRNE
jgi:hypothetical protein